MTKDGVWTIDNKNETKLLRKKAADFDFSAEGGSASGGKKFTKKEIYALIKRMRDIMKTAFGIGLSANQIGLDSNLFVAQVNNKFYAVFNPKITKKSDNAVLMEEGCLSAPDVFGEVERWEKVVLEGYDKNGKKIKIKAWGLLARVFQHEIDHLNGKIFIDTAENLHKYEPSRKFSADKE